MAEQTVECTRDGCETDIPLIRENLVVLRPEVPLLSAKCPECGKTRVLTKDVSIELVEKYFKGELDDLDELEDMNCDGPVMPSKDLSKLVEETLDLLGYKGKKWKDKVRAITEFVKSGPTYQTPQGLHQLLAAWKIDVQHIPMIVEKVFGTVNSQGQIPQYNMPQYNMPQNAGNVIPNYSGAMGDRSAPVGAGYSMTQAPNGQVIVLPPPTPPTSTVKQAQESDDTITIEEKIGKKGEVVSRVIKQKATTPGTEQKSGIEELGSMLSLLNDMGVIGNKNEPVPQPPAVSPEIAKTLERISGVLNILSTTQSSARADRDDNDTAHQYKSELKELNNEIKQMRDDQHKAEMLSLKNEINALRNSAVSTSPAGLNDFQFEIDSKQKNLQRITEAVESTGGKLIEPLVEMQKMQAKLNGLLAIRQLEISDQVPPGTYTGAMAPKEDVSDQKVSEDLEMWRERASTNDVDDIDEEQL